MNIAIISEESHAKPMILALQKDGHIVNRLGGDAKLTIPDSADLIICRTASCSHAAFNTAIAEKRKGNREVIIANGITEILESVRAQVVKNGTAKAQAPILPPVLASKPLTAAQRAQAAIPQLVALLGAYSPMLHVQSAGPTVEWMASRRGDRGAQGLELWKKGLGIDVKTIREVFKVLRTSAASSSPYFVQEAYLTTWLGGPKQTYFLVTDPEAMNGLYSRLGVTSTLEAAKAKVEAKRLENIALTQAKNAATKVAAPPMPISPLEEANQRAVEKFYVPTGRPVLLEAPTAPAPAPAPALTSETIVASLPKSGAWDADLRVALGMLRAEMRKTGVQKVTLGLDGSFEFDRVITIIDRGVGGLGADE